MKKLIILLSIVLITAGCSNMLNDLAQVELESGDKLILTGTDGAEVTGTTVDADADGTIDGIDVNGDGAADFDIIAEDSTTSAGVYAVDTNDDGQTDMYITVSSTGTSTINTATDGTGSPVTVAVASDGTISLGGDDAPAVSGSGTDAGTTTSTVAATTDINGDGIIDAADTALLAKLTFTVSGDSVTITGADSDISGVLNIPATYDGKAVTSIGDEAFKDCSSLTAVTIASGISSIGTSAFEGCSSLDTVTIPESVSVLDSCVFKDCTALSAVTIPANVTTIASEVFSGCDELESITILSGNAPTIESDAFTGIPTPVSLSYPDSATGYDTAGSLWVDDSVFYKTDDQNGDGIVDASDASLLEKITFSIIDGNATITGVTDTSISGTLNIPTEYEDHPVTAISDDAFKDCTALTSITIPAGVASIGNQAFQNCSNLSALTLLTETAPTTGTDAFDGITDIVTLEYSTTSTGFETAGTPWVDTSIFHKTGDVNNDGIIDDVDITLSTELTFTLSGDEATLTGITNTAITGELIIPATYEGKPVTAIANEALKDCSALTSITIPDGVTDIGFKALANCSALTSLNIPDSVTAIEPAAFEACTSLTSVTIPSGITAIYNSFNNCTALTTISIPSGVTTIGMSAFEGCSALSSVTIPSTVTTINGAAFKDCDSLTSINLPDNVTDISSEAFSGCTSLSTITMPANLTTINDSAFKDCSSISALTIPEDVTSIDDYAFQNCANLSILTMLPDAAPTTGTDVFDGVSNIVTLIYPSGATGYGSVGTPWVESTLFYNNGDQDGDGDVDAADTTLLDKLTFTTSGDEVTLSGVTDVTISGTLNIPVIYDDKPVTAIDSSVFKDCTALNYVTIPGSVISIGDYAFQDCSNMLELELLHTAAPSTGTDVFDGVLDTTLKISSGATGYDTSPWNDDTIFTLYGDIDGDYDYDTDDTTLLGLLTFEITSDTEIKLTGVTDDTISGTLVIPYTHDDRTVTKLDSGCLKNCTSLTNVIVPEGVTAIGSTAFQGCSSLESVTLSSNTFIIYMYAFEGCSSLTSFTLPSGCSYLKENVFQNCTSLTTVDLSSDVTTINDRTFDGCTSLTSITLPSGLTDIGDYAFRYCSNLTSIDLPAGIESMDSFVFAFCDKLESITIPTGLSDISYAAFQHCIALTSINIPSNITSIGNFAFQECTSLATVTMEGATAPTVDDTYGFHGIADDCALRIPSGASGYDVDPWTDTDIFSTITTY